MTLAGNVPMPSISSGPTPVTNRGIRGPQVISIKYVHKEHLRECEERKTVFKAIVH